MTLSLVNEVKLKNKLHNILLTWTFKQNSCICPFPVRDLGEDRYNITGQKHIKCSPFLSLLVTHDMMQAQGRKVQKTI